jgi:hypothetical protein
MITGADDLAIGELGDDAPRPTTGSGGGGTGASAGSGGTPGSGGGGGQGGGVVGGAGPSGPGGGTAETMAGAAGVTLTKVALYQAVERPLMQAGAAAPATAPIVAGRDAVVRVFYETAGYDGKPVTARLTIGGAAPIETQATLGGASNDGTLSSTVNFDVPGAMLQPNVSWRVDLLQPNAGSDHAGARFPASPAEQAPLDVDIVGKLVLTYVPVKYNADGSGRLPDTSPAALQKLTDGFYATYPVEDVVVKVRAPFDWNQSVNPGGGGWDTLLTGIADLRQSDNVPGNEFYYGLVAPKSSFQSYCAGGCVAGIGFVGSAGQEYFHAALGIGYQGGLAVGTALQEIAHAHGRLHAPCGAPDVDPKYPYAKGGIGSWGYDLLNGKLYDPADFVDFMSYCSPIWISDYTFAALAARVKINNGVKSEYVPPEVANLTYQRLLVGGAGPASWLEPITLPKPPAGESVTLTATTAEGDQALTGTLVRTSKGGGVLFVPPPEALDLEKATNVVLEFGGKLVAVP